eukprot:363770-Chlamydomonas_euryale.AAC.9
MQPPLLHSLAAHLANPPPPSLVADLALCLAPVPQRCQGADQILQRGRAHPCAKDESVATHDRCQAAGVHLQPAVAETIAGEATHVGIPCGHACGHSIWACMFVQCAPCARNAPMQAQHAWVCTVLHPRVVRSLPRAPQGVCRCGSPSAPGASPAAGAPRAAVGRARAAVQDAPAAVSGSAPPRPRGLPHASTLAPLAEALPRLTGVTRCPPMASWCRRRPPGRTPRLPAARRRPARAAPPAAAAAPPPPSRARRPTPAAPPATRASVAPVALLARPATRCAAGRAARRRPARPPARPERRHPGRACRSQAHPGMGRA